MTYSLVNDRPPTGTELELLSIRMFEIYQFEQFESLRKGLIRLFPNKGALNNIESINNYFMHHGNSITGGGWMYVGFISGKNKIFGKAGPYKNLPNLPDTIDYIDLHLHKYFPSILVITFDVYLNNSISKQIDELQKAKYWPESNIESIYLAENFFGISSNYQMGNGKKEILKCLIEIRREIEREIRPYIDGIFLEKSNEIVKLPAIEIYGLKGCFKSHKNFISWANDARGWWESFGFSFYDGFFRNEKILFNWDFTQSKDDIVRTNRVIVFWERYISDVNIKMYGNNEKLAISHNFKDFLDCILAPFAIIEILNLEIKNIENFREIIFPQMKRKKIGNPNISKLVKSKNELQQDIGNIERLFLEFDQTKDFIERKFKKYETGKMNYECINIKENKEEYDFEKHTYKRIDYLKGTVLSQIKLINESFQRYVELMNLDAVYRLQKNTLWLSVIAIILSLLNNDQIFAKILSLFILAK